jgi:tetratricopeptide (TPR) repeat protein
MFGVRKEVNMNWLNKLFRKMAGPERPNEGEKGTSLKEKVKKIPKESSIETDHDISRRKNKKDAVSTIPGLWESYYNHRDTPSTHLLKISRHANRIEIMFVDRWSLRGPKYPKDKYYDIHLDGNGIKWKEFSDGSNTNQVSVELRLIDENLLRGSFEDTKRGRADYELRRVSESNSYGRKNVEDTQPAFIRSDGHFKRGVDLDNAGDINGAIREYTEAIQLDNHPLAYYCRACAYKDLRRHKEAIGDFRSYLKYGSESTPEGIASRVSIEELENKLSDSPKLEGKRSKVICPLCRCNLIIVAENIDGFEGSKKLKCPECGQTTVKL